MPRPDDAWQAEQLGSALDDVARGGLGTPASRAPRCELDLPEARALLADRLRGRPTRANFRTGDMTICTLVPMRSVPHRVVCLLGLDDGLFPRPGDQDGDDLLLADPQVGRPRRPRARTASSSSTPCWRLLSTWSSPSRGATSTSTSGARRRCPYPSSWTWWTGQCAWRPRPRAPARRSSSNTPSRRSTRSISSPERSGLPAPWRFDEAELDGARAVTVARRPRLRFPAGRLPPRQGTTVQLASLVRFLEHPVKAFLRERLGFYAGDFPEQLSDALPIELGAPGTVGARGPAARGQAGRGQPGEGARRREGAGPPAPGRPRGRRPGRGEAVVEALVAAVGRPAERQGAGGNHRGQHCPA